MTISQSWATVAVSVASAEKICKQFVLLFLVWRRARHGNQTSSKTSQGRGVGWEGGLQPSQPPWICLCFPTKFSPWVYHYCCLYGEISTLKGKFKMKCYLGQGPWYLLSMPIYIYLHLPLSKVLGDVNSSSVVFLS